MKRLLILTMLFLGILSSSCTRWGKGEKVMNSDPRHHHGKLLKGHGYYLEVLGDAEHVRIYPYVPSKENPAHLVPISPDKVDLEGLYSTPLSKSEYGIHFFRRKSFFYGEVDVDSKDNDRYHLDLKAQVNGKRDKFQRVEIKL